MGNLPTEIIAILPNHVLYLLDFQASNLTHQIEEIRLREGQPLSIVAGEGDWFIRCDGTLIPGVEPPLGSYIVTKEDIRKTLNLLSHSSLYAMEEELRNGFFTLPGGHRVGVVGRAVVQDHSLKTLKYISGLNVRIAREVKGCANGVMGELIDFNNGQLYSTLIVSPPQAGKTTLLRDIVRQASWGMPSFGIRGQKVCVIDERSEIAACHDGVPQLDVGPRTDVLDRCPKSIGILMALRSMSPQVIATDELGRPADAEAIMEGVCAGVSIVATVHGRDLEEAQARPGLKRALNFGVFSRAIILSRRYGPGTVESVVHIAPSRETKKVKVLELTKREPIGV